MPSQLPATPVGAAMRAWMGQLQVERGVAHNTVLSYTRDLARYAGYLERAGVRGLDDITNAHVTDFLAGLREGDEAHRPLSVASAARMLVTVRGFHRFVEQEGLAAADPAAQVVPPRAAQRLPKAITVDEVSRLIQAAGVGDGPVPLRDRALVEFLYGTGARISEAVGVTLDDLDLTTTEVRLAGKGGKDRVVPLGSYACDALSAYLVRGRPALVALGAGTPHVFLNGRGAALSRQSAWNLIQAASSRARLAQHVSPHTLRHSFATHLLDGGADVRVVQELLGHASVTTTQIYTLVTTQHLREVYAQAHPRAR